MSGGFYSQTCFIAQQSAEKALKAFCFFKVFDIVKSHSLFQIVKALGENGEVEKLAKEFDLYYVSFPSGSMISISSNNQILQKNRPRVSILDFDRHALLALIHDNLRQKKVMAAYIFGSFARETENAWSDIDLIVVKDSSLPFIERPREFFDLLDLGVPLDILVYTPVEFAKMRREGNGFWKEVYSKIFQILF